MELKYEANCLVNKYPRHSNRTFMELKSACLGCATTCLGWLQSHLYGIEIELIKGFYTNTQDSNRTFMELK